MTSQPLTRIFLAAPLTLFQHGRIENNLEWAQYDREWASLGRNYDFSIWQKSARILYLTCQSR